MKLPGMMDVRVTDAQGHFVGRVCDIDRIEVSGGFAKSWHLYRGVCYIAGFYEDYSVDGQTISEFELANKLHAPAPAEESTTDLRVAEPES